MASASDAMASASDGTASGVPGAGTVPAVSPTHDAGAEGLDLRSDCARCFGLCCVALPFSASADFAIDKPAGRPCPHLERDLRCGIHGRLRERGFPGCAAYECFGAGQRVSRITFGGVDWRSGQGDGRWRMFEVFPSVRRLHELLWYLTEALTLRGARPLHGELRRALDGTDRLAGGTPDDLAKLDLAAHRREVGGLLRRASELVRTAALGAESAAAPDADSGGGAPRTGRDLRGADLHGVDLIGGDMRGADLRGADLRGAYLIGADLRRADLWMADLIGADLRAADLRGADLGGSIFLTQSQVDAAKGDSATRLPSSLRRPPHWARRQRA
jgi:Pentapeptide repeats (8 copies)